MEQILEKSFEHAPALVAIVAVVWIFAKVLLKLVEQFVSTVKEINRENMEARMESRRVIDANTKAALENTGAMYQMTEVMRTFLTQTKNPT